MKTRKTWALLPALAPALVVSMVAGEAPATSSEPRTPIFSGQLLGADGNPVAGAPVGVAALMDAEAGIQVAEPIASTQTDSAGYWAIYDLESIPSGGFDSVEITGTIDDSPVIYEFPATAATLTSLEEDVQDGARISRRMATRNLAAVSAVSEPLVLQAGEGRVEPGGAALGYRTARAAAVSEESQVAGAGDVEAAEEATGPQDGFAEAALPTEPTGPCMSGSEAYFYKNLNTYKQAWIPLKSSKTLGKSTLTYNFRTVRQTDTEVAMTGSGGEYAGGFTVTESNGSSDTVTPDWPNNTSKLVKAKWRFRRQQRWCYWESMTGLETKPTGVFKWVPWDFPSGYTKPIADSVGFECQTRGPVNSKISYEATVSVKWVKWFSIAGIKLSNTQTQSDMTSLTVDPDTGQTPKYCGSRSGGLKVSGWVKEVPS